VYKFNNEKHAKINFTIRNLLFSNTISHSDFFGTIIGLGGGDIDSVFDQTNDANKTKLENNNDLTTIKVKLNKNNLDIAKHDRLNVIGYLNGEGQTKYNDLKYIDGETSTTTYTVT
jgi:hypothetical protein